VADCQAFAWPTEHDLGADHKAGQPDGVDLGTPDGYPARFDRTMEIGIPDRCFRLMDVRQRLGELLGGTAGHVRLGLAGVIDDLPVREMCCGHRGGPAQHGRHDGKVARSDHSDGSVASQPV
jgi:hypothetical protein